MPRSRVPIKSESGAITAVRNRAIDEDGVVYILGDIKDLGEFNEKGGYTLLIAVIEENYTKAALEIINHMRKAAQSDVYARKAFKDYLLKQDNRGRTALIFTGKHH